MDQQHLWRSLAFAIVVTLAMNALDMLYHVATNTAVHLHYVAVKATVIFATVLLIAVIVGRGRTPGIVTSILGPVAFYIYYTVATPTLDRSLFTLDEAVWYVVVHAIALGIAYWLMQSQIVKNKERLPFAVLVSLAALPLYWGWLMELVKLTGGLDEQTTTVMTFGTALLVLVILFVLVYLATLLPRSWWPGILAGVAFGIVGLLFRVTLIDAGARVLVVAVPYLLTYFLWGEK
ncbi:MAG TPA: hypothetical protein VLJ21_01075 [Candidatus Binatia bacterium]|nr:hypothetical protein [Candidatus Binatia bacterium]